MFHNPDFESRAFCGCVGNAYPLNGFLDSLLIRCRKLFSFCVDMIYVLSTKGKRFGNHVWWHSNCFCLLGRHPPSIFLEDSLAKSIQEMKTIKEVLPKLHKKRSSFHYFSTKIETRNCWSIERTIFPTILKCMMLNDYGWFGDLLIWSLVAPNSIAFDAFSENVKQHDRIFPRLSDNFGRVLLLILSLLTFMYMFMVISQFACHWFSIIL